MERGVWRPSRVSYQLEDSETQTHAWLELGEVIIDVTADQFSDGPGRVVVTTDRSWHRQFGFTRRDAYDEVMAFAASWAEEFESVYRSIREHRRVA